MYVLAQPAHQSETVEALPAAFKWGILFVALLFAVGLIHAVSRHGKRDRAVRRAAAAAGMQYNDSDPAGIRDIRFQAFSFAKRIQVSNVVTQRDDAVIARAFDYQSYDEIKSRRRGGDAMADSMFGFSTGGDDFNLDTVEQTTRVFGKARSGGFVKVNAFLPSMSILPANALTRAFERVAEDIDFESDEFNRSYDVRCLDKRFAWLFCDAQMIDFMLSFEGKMGFETFGNNVMCYGKLLDPNELTELCRRLTSVPAMINPLVYQEYPTSEFAETRDAVNSWQARPDGSGGFY